MNDFFDRYKKKKTLHHLGIFWLAFVLAAGVQTALFSGNSGEYITASIIDVVSQEEEVIKADIYWELEDTMLLIKNGQTLSEIESMSFTLAYNPELWTLETKQLTENGIEVLAEENEAGLIYVQLMFQEAQNIPSGTQLARFAYAKKADGRQAFNIIQASFTDIGGEIFLLTSSWTEY